jgi:hypothetical protein
VFENRVLRRIFGPKSYKVTVERSGENCMTRSLMIRTHNPTLFGLSNREE